MLSTNTSALEFYSAIAASPQLLANGYPLIRDYLLQGQQQRRDTLLHLIHPQVPVLALVLNLYPNEILTNPLVSDTEKDSTVQYLLDILQQQLVAAQQASSRTVSQLFQFLHKIHNSEGFQRWVELYLRVLTKLSQHPALFSVFLINILKQADDRVSILSEQLVSKLLDFPFNVPEDRLEIYYYLLKSLAFRVDTDPDAIDSYVRPHLNAVLAFVRTNLRQSARCLKFGLKTMTLLFGDYGVEVPPVLVAEIETTSEYLMAEYISFLSTSSNFQRDELEEEEQPIEVALYQMLQLMMTLYGSRAKITVEKVVYLCVISTYLCQGQYSKYCTFSDQYLMDVEDEGETNIRNKSTYFLNELIEHQKIGEKCVKILTEYCSEVLLGKSSPQKIAVFLLKHRLPSQTLQLGQLYTESALFILHSFSDELMVGKVNEISAVLLQLIKDSPSNSITPILSVLVLNKCARAGTAQQKQYYLSILLQLIQPYIHNVGMLIAIARGVYLLSPQQELTGKGNPSLGLLLGSLLQYLFRQDSAQEESAYLVLEFLIHCLCNQDNRVLFQQLVPFEKEILLLKRFLSTGMTSSMMIEFTSKLGNPNTLQAIFNEILAGYAKDEHLAEIISKSIKNKYIILSERDIMQLCRVYAAKLDMVTAIVEVFLEECPLQDQELVDYLSREGRREWLAGLLKQRKLSNIEQHFIKSVELITLELQSPEEVENQLLIPYYAILNSAQNAITILNSKNLLIDFFQKLYRYAKLFQGTHLRIATSHMFISLGEQLPHLVPKVVELVKGYGAMESNQWEDEEDLEAMIDFDMTEGLIEKMFNRIVNDKVEHTFKFVFGELVWDSKALYQRLAALEAAQ